LDESFKSIVPIERPTPKPLATTVFGSGFVLFIDDSRISGIEDETVLPVSPIPL
jgi:hypothetical protein